MKSLTKHLLESTEDELIGRGRDLYRQRNQTGLSTFADIDDVPSNAFAYTIRVTGLRGYAGKSDKMYDLRPVLEQYVSNWTTLVSLNNDFGGDFDTTKSPTTTFHDGNGYDSKWSKGEVGFEFVVDDLTKIKNGFDSFVAGLIKILRTTPTKIVISTLASSKWRSSTAYYTVFQGR